MRVRSIVLALDFVIAAPFWSEVCCAIYYFIATSLLRLDREALPLVLSASLLARGLTARFVSLAFYPQPRLQPQIHHLSKLLHLCIFTFIKKYVIMIYSLL